jgi:putative peptidoglycan lipid II flippase
LPSVARLGLLSWPRWRPAMAGVKRIGQLMIPGIFGSSMAQVNLLLESVIASFLVSGSIAWLYFGDRIMEFQLGVFSIALATVILPALSAQHAADDREKFSATLDWALRLVVVLTVPAAVALLTLAGPLSATIFGYGQMARVSDIRMTSYALMAYSWGLVGFSLVKVLAPGYFARQDTRRPVKVGLIALAVGMTINVAIVLPAHYLGFPAPHVLLATSTCVAAAVNATMLWRGLKRDDVWHARPGWGRLLLQVAIASLLMASMLIWQAFPLQSWLDLPAAGRIARLAACVIGGAGIYFVVLWVMGMRLKQWRQAA